MKKKKRKRREKRSQFNNLNYAIDLLKEVSKNLEDTHYELKRTCDNKHRHAIEEILIQSEYTDSVIKIVKRVVNKLQNSHCYIERVIDEIELQPTHNKYDNQKPSADAILESAVKALDVITLVSF